MSQSVIGDRLIAMIRRQKTQRVTEEEATFSAAWNAIDGFRSDEWRNFDFGTSFMKVLDSVPLEQFVDDDALHYRDVQFV